MGKPRKKRDKYTLNLKGSTVEMTTYVPIEGGVYHGVMFETFDWDGFIDNKEIPKLIKFLERAMKEGAG